MPNSCHANTMYKHPTRLVSKNYNGVAIRRMVKNFFYCLFSSFHRIPACDGRTDGHLATA